MFDPSFFELIIICVVALLVLGPDKLPGAIKTLGLWIGRLRRSFNNIKREIEHEVGADEIRRQLRNEAIMEKFNATKSEVTQSIESVKKEADAIKDDLNIKKQFTSGVDNKPEQSTAAAGEDIDPVEKLPTNDPAARVIPQSTTQTATPAPDTKPSSDAETKPSATASSSIDSGNSEENPDKPA